MSKMRRFALLLKEVNRATVTMIRIGTEYSITSSLVNDIIIQLSVAKHNMTNTESFARIFRYRSNSKGNRAYAYAKGRCPDAKREMKY